VGELPAILLAVGLLLANAFFVGAEFALISARRTMIEPRVAAGSRAARIALGAMENVTLMMAGAQLGITICSLGLGAVGEPALAHLVEPVFEALSLPPELIHPTAFAVALAVVVVLHVVIGEMVPKNIALAGPERSAILLAPPLVLIVWVLKPFVVALNAVANLVLRAFGVRPRSEVTSAFTRDEVAGLVSQSRQEGLLDDDEHELLAGALIFDERDARSVVLARDRVVAVPLGATAADVEVLAAQTGYSRFPVRDAEGALVGYLHLKDVLEVEEHRRRAVIPASRVRPLASVRAGDTLRSVLSTMQASGAHLGQVIDDEGGEDNGAGFPRSPRVLGVLALEDVLEELVGEIRDNTQRARTGPAPRRRG
jgi:CBS domain containing-hemolysin-like protein